MSNNGGPCPVCKTPTSWLQPRGFEIEIGCPRCTRFSLTMDTETTLAAGHVPVGLVSGYLRRQYEYTGEPAFLDHEDVERIIAKGPPPFTERVERYLLEFSKMLNSLNDRAEVKADALIAAAYCGSSRELDVIVHHLITEQFLNVPPQQGATQRGYLSPSGHIECDRLKTTRTLSSQGFVAMWFNPEMSEAWKLGIEPAIVDAGYTPMRIDNKEHINDITDEILAEIRASRFLVADLTWQRGGVYYEAGFGYGLDKPVFYTCKAGDEDKVHFDVRQLACIFWTDSNDLRKRLRARIEAVIGAGPKKGS